MGYEGADLANATKAHMIWTNDIMQALMPSGNEVSITPDENSSALKSYFIALKMSIEKSRFCWFDEINS